MYKVHVVLLFNDFVHTHAHTLMAIENFHYLPMFIFTLNKGNYPLNFRIAFYHGCQDAVLRSRTFRKVLNTKFPEKYLAIIINMK